MLIAAATIVFFLLVAIGVLAVSIQIISLHFCDAYLNHQNYQPWTYLKGSNLACSETDTNVHPVSIAFM